MMVSDPSAGGAGASRSKAIVVGHADLASGLISAVEAITGLHELFIPVSNSGLASAELSARLVALVDEHHVRVVFTDLPMGSCSMAAHRLLRERPDVIIVTGVNLPMLLHAAMNDGEAPATLADGSVERAREALRVVAANAVRAKPAVTPEARGDD